MVDRLSSYYYNRGLYYVYDNNMAPALECLKKSVCCNRRNTTAWNLLGLCFYRLGRFGMAEYCWVESIKNGDPGDASVYLDDLKADISAGYPFLGKVCELSAKGRYKEALKVLDEGVPEGLKKTAAVLKYAGILKYITGKKDSAAKLWEKAAAMDKSDVQAFLYLHFAPARRDKPVEKVKKVISTIFGKKDRM